MSDSVPRGKLSGKVALVTGASRGIGLAICARLAADGADVAGFDLAGVEWAECEQAVVNNGGRFASVGGDVTKSDDWTHAVEFTIQHLGRLDILVNNAGIAGNITAIVEYPEDVFDRVMAVNVRGVFLGTKIAGQAIVAGGAGGSIINIASVSGLGGSRFTCAYTASKHAVLGLTKVAALEFAREGVRVNAVCPALTATEMVFNLEKTLSPGDSEVVRKRLAGSIPMGRYGEPAEIAAAVSFLASADASFMTGSAMLLDGGLQAG